MPTKTWLHNSCETASDDLGNGLAPFVYEVVGPPVVVAGGGGVLIASKVVMARGHDLVEVSRSVVPTS